MNAVRVFAGIALLATVAAGAEMPNFSGKWEFNPSRSQNIGMMAEMKMLMTAAQTRDDVVFISVTTFNGKDQTSQVRFDLAGKPVANHNPMEATAETVTKWDGDRLVTTWTSEGSVAGTKSVRQESRYLADGGRTLMVESRRGKSPALVMVYERK